MAQKFDIYHETGWDETNQSYIYEKLTTIKNEQMAINFANDIINVGEYGNMIIKTKRDGKVWVYDEQTKSWHRE